MTSVPPIDVVGIAVGILLFTVAVNPLAALLVLGWYRRAVGRSMLVSTAAAPARPGPHVPGPPRPVASRPGRPLVRELDHGGRRGRRGRRGPRTPLAGLAADQVRRATASYAVAGLASGLTSAVALLVTNGLEVSPLRTVTVTVVFSWPLVPTLALVAAWDRRTTTAAVLGYAAVVVALGVLGGAGVAEILALIGLFLVPGSLVLAAVAGRRVRAVGPFLAPSLIVLGGGS